MKDRDVKLTVYLNGREIFVKQMKVEDKYKNYSFRMLAEEGFSFDPDKDYINIAIDEKR